MSQPIAEDVARAVLWVLADDPPVIIGIDERANVCIALPGGWLLYPFCDGGDLDYIDSVRGPDGSNWDIDVEWSDVDPVWRGRVDGGLSAGVLFNWSPPPRARRTFERCPCGYLPGHCWAERYEVKR